MIMEMTKISYGLVEATHYWYKNLKVTFEVNDYDVSKKDKCVFIRRTDNKVAYCGTTVDDCFSVTTKDDKWINKQTAMLKDAYEAVEIELGDELGVIGIQVKMDCANKKVILIHNQNLCRVLSMLLK